MRALVMASRSSFVGLVAFFALFFGGCQAVQDAAVDAALSGSEQVSADDLGVDTQEQDTGQCPADVFGLTNVDWGSVKYLQFDRTEATTVTVLVSGIKADLSGFMQLSRQGAYGDDAPEASGAMFFDVDIKTTGAKWVISTHFDWQKICDPRQVDAKILDEGANPKNYEPYSYYFESNLEQDEQGNWFLGGTLWLEMEKGVYTAFADIDNLVRTH